MTLVLATEPYSDAQLAELQNAGLPATSQVIAAATGMKMVNVAIGTTIVRHIAVPINAEGQPFRNGIGLTVDDPGEIVAYGPDGVLTRASDQDPTAPEEIGPEDCVEYGFPLGISRPAPTAPEAPAPEPPAATPQEAPIVAAVATEAATDPVVGAIAPAEEGGPAIPTTTVPFPHDPNAAHALDSLSPGATVVKTSATGFSIDQPNSFSDGNNIAAGDVLQHVPVGTIIAKGEAATAVTLPATATRGQVTSIGTTIHDAASRLWGWLVTEGHAVVTELKKL